MRNSKDTHNKTKESVREIRENVDWAHNLYTTTPPPPPPSKRKREKALKGEIEGEVALATLTLINGENDNKKDINENNIIMIMDSYI